MTDTDGTGDARARGEAAGTFTAEERAAMKEAAREAKAAARRGGRVDREAGERELLAKIAEMPPADRAMAERIHAIVMAAAPILEPRTWYGMPAYARDGKVVVFFKPAAKFKVRYAEVGFNEWAHLDDGDMWPTVFAVTAIDPAIEARLTELVLRAVS
jgi:uncharacterized protein YdhG (YjbR/CyaY superfamily)